ncbi:methyltransferase domain-containing protein [Dactylosporangium sp. NPDC051485]|uniref:class I SAM-dependent methyltransferase n=1 Tax=Dactylosporangium sp. NPDC051485 TaxID=3154846 RepID=UPI00342F52B1
MLPPTGVPKFIHSNIPPGAAILDLGGTGGLVAHRLIELGHPVVVVDDSTAMLAQVRGARTVQADIETLDLGEDFPVVLVVSPGINAADDRRRAALLAACRRHVSPTGQVIAQWLPPWWFDTAVSWTGQNPPGAMAFEVLSFDGTVLQGRMSYRLKKGLHWEHEVAWRRLSPEELDAALAEAGLRFNRHLGRGRQLFSAVPIGVQRT